MMRNDYHRWVMVSEVRWDLFYMVDMMELRNCYERIPIGHIEKEVKFWRGRLHPSFQMYVEPVGPLKMVAKALVTSHLESKFLHLPA